jgi:hypothetical protein
MDFANAAAGIGWTPVLLIPGSLATDEVLAMPSPFAGRVSGDAQHAVRSDERRQRGVSGARRHLSPARR